ARANAAEQEERARKGLPPRVFDEQALQARVAELEGELADLRQVVKAIPEPVVDEAIRAIDPPDGDIVGPREQADRPENQRYVSGQDNSIGTHRTVTID